jgi:hypothetical protein
MVWPQSMPISTKETAPWGLALDCSRVIWHLGLKPQVTTLRCRKLLPNHTVLSVATGGREAANPRFVQVTVGFVSALLFGVFYLVLIYAFVRGREWIRLPATFYAGMIVMGTSVYLAVGALGDAPLFALACGPGSGFD